MSKELTKVAVFKGRNIRKIIYNNEWWFSVVDIVAVLTNQEDNLKARKYWNKLGQRLREEGGEVVTNCHRLKLLASDGKYRETDCANIETLFRIIQSIPSPKAEPFKLWLAKVGYERVKEIENPELAAKRTRALYKAKGYSEDWIEKRIRGIAIRGELTKQWENRGVKKDIDYAILTAEISNATFGMTPSEYMKFKNLKKENLRDHMNDLELIFSMLGEKSTTELTKIRDSQRFNALKVDANEGGSVAGNARKELEYKMKVSTEKNYIKGGDRVKRLG